MKEIKAYVKSHKVARLLLILKDEPHVKIINVCSCHLPDGFEEKLEDLLDYVKVEVICAADHAKDVIDDIKTHASTGLRNDGYIFVSSFDKTIDITNSI